MMTPIPQLADAQMRTRVSRSNTASRRGVVPKQTTEKRVDLQENRHQDVGQVYNAPSTVHGAALISRLFNALHFWRADCILDSGAS